MNKVIQVVTLGADPEVKEYGDGKSLAKFSGAVAKRYTKEGEDSVDWFNYVAFGATADFIGKYFKKGSKMLVEGEIHNNNYTKDDGTKVYGVQITVNVAEFYGKKSDGNVPNGNSATSKPDSNSSAKAESAPATSSYESYDDF